MKAFHYWLILLVQITISTVYGFNLENGLMNLFPNSGLQRLTDYFIKGTMPEKSVTPFTLPEFRKSNDPDTTIPPDAENNNQCCYQLTCYNPCPFNMIPPQMVPIYPVPQGPIVVHARTYFEPVIHDHPPPDRIREILKRKRPKFKRPKVKDTESDCDSEEDTDETSIDTDSDIDYFGDFMHVKG